MRAARFVETEGKLALPVIMAGKIKNIEVPMRSPRKAPLIHNRFTAGHNLVVVAPLSL